MNPAYVDMLGATCQGAMAVAIPVEGGLRVKVMRPMDRSAYESLHHPCVYHRISLMVASMEETYARVQEEAAA